uniref:Uncharacterized protein n=1 Tax=Naja naja TaxID=35670 RepID=A0A8C6XIF4_NAJNA
RGILSIVSYVREHKLLIDGNHFYHRLYFDSNLDIQHFSNRTKTFLPLFAVMSGNSYILICQM